MIEGKEIKIGLSEDPVVGALAVGSKTTDNYAYRSPGHLSKQPGDLQDRLQLTGTRPSRGGRTQNLDVMVNAYAEAARAPNTARAYQSDLADFARWGGLVPATADEVSRYLAERAQILTPSTLRRRMAALAMAHRELGAPDPASADLVRRVMRGIARIHGRRARQVQPLTPSLLTEVVEGIGAAQRDVRDRALILVGYFGALRRSELVALDWEACRGSLSGQVVLLVRRSKTDQEAKGREVILEPTRDAICPVAALQRLCDLQQHPVGPIFRNGQDRLSDQTVARVVKRRLARVGVDCAEFSGHSMRAGYITNRALQGMNGGLIARQSGHQSQQQLATYVRVPSVLTRLR